MKDVINRGGEKIGPIEIDLALESIAGVREAAAFAMPHPTLGEELVAAAVREPGTTLTESVRRSRWCLADYRLNLKPRSASGILPPPYLNCMTQGTGVQWIDAILPIPTQL